MTVCKYRDVSERDMDLLFMEAFVTDHEFPKLFLEKTEQAGKPFDIIHAERSKVDNKLGESDLTIICSIEEKRFALLIEDKIDAIAMDNQYERYKKRGELAVQNGEYNNFAVFIVCPKKYRESNDEAKKYDYYVSYEECQEYFSRKEDAHSKLWNQQICQAIETMKPEYKVTINEIAVDSFRKYAEYQKEHFPRLKLQNHPESNTVNGWWPHFVVPAKGMYILHKTDRDAVDLTISGAASRMKDLLTVRHWLRDNVDRRIELEKTGKSASFRIRVPKIQMGVPFERWNMDELNSCFETIQELNDLAQLFKIIDEVVFNNR